MISLTHLRNVSLALIILLTLVLCGRVGAESIDWDTLIPIVIQIESSGNPYAVSQDGCIGLMQISELVYREYVNNVKWTCENCDGLLFNPDQNKEVGSWYLHRIWEHYLPHYKLEQTIENLLIAYNFGIGNLVKYRQGKVKLPQETQQYLEKYRRLARAE